VIKVLQM